MIRNLIYTPPGPALPEDIGEVVFEHLSHDEQRAMLETLDKRDVVYLLLMTADRVNELERSLLKIRNQVQVVLDTADIE